ncbi:hypothetical protein PMG11_03333 [Penicillium brasilianum]|uniref:Uncharacterized protein n=1 Tax=Penicillium brasilianum TaxID=104259 RepID=A0A0F7V9V7_PENBI|nr:hypothetical protein PMG11_03333 [Penicillium brasilianum]
MPSWASMMLDRFPCATCRHGAGWQSKSEKEAWIEIIHSRWKIRLMMLLDGRVQPIHRSFLIPLSSFLLPPPLQFFHILYSFIFHTTLPILLLGRAVYRGRVSIMSIPSSYPNPSPRLPSQFPTALHQNHLHQDHPYIPAIMNSYPYPSSFGFNTASVAIARERAGNRTRPEPRAPRPVQTDDRQSPLVSWIMHQDCHSPVFLHHISCFLIVHFVHHRLHISRH